MTPSKPQSGPSLAEILASLSHALDLTEGQTPGHAVRTARIAGRIAEELGLSREERVRLHYAALLKDSGCSTNAARIQCAFGGDELLSKHDVKFVDWSRLLVSVGFALGHAERGAPLGRRIAKMLELARTPPSMMDEVTLARCSRGADIARQLGFDEATAEVVRYVDEHWDGRGSPSKLRRERIPRLARILCLAQTLEVFAYERGASAAYEMLKRRTGRWFEPEVARAARAVENDREFWDAQRELAWIEPPEEAHAATDADIDEVCLAFAQIVDAKSSFTASHSTRVTEYAVAIGARLGIGGPRMQSLRRAALLHDIGKLGVSNAILDKPGRLDSSEWEAVRRHPVYTRDILSPIRGFARITEIAAAHHERLDGRGYPFGVAASGLDLEMRILAVADVFDALTAKRPYRAPMPKAHAFSILREESGTALDADCVDAAREIFYGTEEPAGQLSGS